MEHQAALKPNRFQVTATLSVNMPTLGSTSWEADLRGCLLLREVIRFVRDFPLRCPFLAPDASGSAAAPGCVSPVPSSSGAGALCGC